MKILFACMGNTCRSPMAEYVMKYLINEAGLSEKIQVFSAGSDANPEKIISKSTKEQLSLHNIPFDENRHAKQFTKSDYDSFDLILCMSLDGINDLEKIVGGDPDKKIRRILKDKDVTDPFKYGNYQDTYNDILQGCTDLLNEIKN